MTRESQKKEESELVQIFLLAYIQDPSKLRIEPYDDNLPEKFDVLAYNLSNPNEKRFNFQVKKIEYHPDDKTKKDNNDEKGAVAAFLNGNIPKKMMVYDYPYSPWQTAVIRWLAKFSKDYSISQKQDMDLLILINDSSLPDSKDDLNDLDSYGFRSINCIHWGGRFSIVLSANVNAPIILQKNINKRHSWRVED